MTMLDWAVDGAYLVSALLFVAGLKKLSKLRGAGAGSGYLVAAVLLAVVATLLQLGQLNYGLAFGALAAGAVLGAAIGFGVKTGTAAGVGLVTACAGAASSLVALSLGWSRALTEETASLAQLLTTDATNGNVAAPALVIALMAGGIALGAGLLAALKGSGMGVDLPARGALWALGLLGALGLTAFISYSTQDPATVRLLLLVSAGVGVALGAVLVLPIAGRDVAIGVALGNVFAGLAAGALGYALLNNGLLMVGAILFAGSLTLTTLFAEGSSRSLSQLFVGGSSQTSMDTGGAHYENVRSCGVQEAAMVLEDAHSVVIVPGFGYAVAQAQHAARELAGLLEKRGASVRYAVHPMAGRMPGHMNLLLSEADVPYSKLHELEEINPDFKSTDVAIVLGGNDIVNPDAETSKDSAVYGMPILKVNEARTVFVIKRSLRPGHSGARNPLFESENTMLLFGDAKKVLQSVATELKGSAGHGGH
jgi:NAD(P) transhydrogenase subunit beta